MGDYLERATWRNRTGPAEVRKKGTYVPAGISPLPCPRPSSAIRGELPASDLGYFFLIHISHSTGKNLFTGGHLGNIFFLSSAVRKGGGPAGRRRRVPSRALAPRNCTSHRARQGLKPRRKKFSCSVRRGESEARGESGTFSQTSRRNRSRRLQ